VSTADPGLDQWCTCTLFNRTFRIADLSRVANDTFVIDDEKRRRIDDRASVDDGETRWDQGTLEALPHDRMHAMKTAALPDECFELFLCLKGGYCFARHAHSELCEPVSAASPDPVTAGFGIVNPFFDLRANPFETRNSRKRSGSSGRNERTIPSAMFAEMFR
jgi:hypothetical protein